MHAFFSVNILCVFAANENEPARSRRSPCKENFVRAAPLRETGRDGNNIVSEGATPYFEELKKERDFGFQDESEILRRSACGIGGRALAHGAFAKRIWHHISFFLRATHPYAKKEGKNLLISQKNVNFAAHLLNWCPDLRNTARCGPTCTEMLGENAAHLLNNAAPNCGRKARCLA